MSETKDYPIDRFLQWIAELVRRDDRGTLAELRRGLSETTQNQAWECAGTLPVISRGHSPAQKIVPAVSEVPVLALYHEVSLAMQVIVPP